MPPLSDTSVLGLMRLLRTTAPPPPTPSSCGNPEGSLQTRARIVFLGCDCPAVPAVRGHSAPAWPARPPPPPARPPAAQRRSRRRRRGLRAGHGGWGRRSPGPHSTRACSRNDPLSVAAPCGGRGASGLAGRRGRKGQPWSAFAAPGGGGSPFRRDRTKPDPRRGPSAPPFGARPGRLVRASWGRGGYTRGHPTGGNGPLALAQGGPPWQAAYGEGPPRSPSRHVASASGHAAEPASVCAPRRLPGAFWAHCRRPLADSGTSGGAFRADFGPLRPLFPARTAPVSTLGGVVLQKSTPDGGKRPRRQGAPALLPSPRGGG